MPLAFAGFGRRRRFVTQRLPQAAHAVAGLAGAQHDFDHGAGEQVLAHVEIEFLRRRPDILQHLFQQHIVTIGQRLNQPAAFGGFLGEHGIRNADQFRRLTFAIAVRTLAHQIDIAADAAVFHDRHLPQHQRRGGVALQRRR